MPYNARDGAYAIESECYNLLRLEEKSGDGKSPTIYAGQIAPIRTRLWRIHELLEEIAGPVNGKTMPR